MTQVINSPVNEGGQVDYLKSVYNDLFIEILATKYVYCEREVVLLTNDMFLAL